MTFSLDPISQLAYDAMLNSHENILLLGKAGTGKSTLIENYIQQAKIQKRKFAVVAPTGVAAVNINGQTIHSFFKFSINVSLEDAKERAHWHKKQKIYQALETLVIDEISMVRADLLDCIDIFLRTARRSHEPFGGVQIIMVGDLLQLPPVVSHSEQAFFDEHYKSAYFFAAHVMNHPLLKISQYHLEKVYRQEDQTFVELLHRIRNNSATISDLEVLNTRVQRITSLAPGEIYLATTNARANQVNSTMLNRLPGEEYCSLALIKGKISPATYPADEELMIKVGAQVMFVVNDVNKRFVNGTLGTIIDIREYEYDDQPNSLEVDIQTTEVAGTITISDHTREVREARYDEKEKVMTSEVVGSFQQLPIRLAWACTIHKAQGKTFDAMIIDVGNGMFAAGQAYVALSRCRSLGGIKLIKPIGISDIMIDMTVCDYLAGVLQEQDIHVARKLSAQKATSSLVTDAAREAFNKRISQKTTDTNSPTSILVFDTETTGVDTKARIVQIACALYEKDDNGKRSCTYLINQLINPKCRIPAQTTAVHGIDNAMVADAPVLSDIRDSISSLFDRAHIHVAHNHSFDERILAQEIRRLKLEKISKRPIYCTMKNGVNITQILSPKGGYKRPKLAQLYTHLWQRELEGYHDALVDVKAAAGCYFKMVGEDFDPLG